MDIYYPRINNESVYDKYNIKDVLMKVLNISKTGVLIESKIPLKIGDFINFTLKIEDIPSFWCLVETKRVYIKDSLYYAGCEFISLNMQQINLIKNYVETRNCQEG